MKIQSSFLIELFVFQSKSCTEQVAKHFSELIRTLETRRDALLKDADTVKDRKQQDLLAERQAFALAASQASASAVEAQRALEVCFGFIVIGCSCVADGVLH